MRKKIKTFLNSILLILAASLVGTLLLILVNIIPSDLVFNNAKGSASTLRELGTNPTLVHDYTGTLIDTYTDAWMLRIAAYNGPESIVDRSLSDYYYGYSTGSDSVVDSTVSLFEGVPGYERFSYARYWHGYQIYLRPMLVLFDYADIIEILRIIILSLIIIIALYMYTEGLKLYIPAFIATLVFINYATIAGCMQYADIILICMVSAIFMLRHRVDIISSQNLSIYLFVLIGVTTAFLDFLTYPMLSLGFAVVMLLNMLITNQAKESEHSSFTLTLTVITHSVFWLLGYALMWAMKWVIASLLTSSNVISDGMNQLNVRTSDNVYGTSISIPSVIKKNIMVWGKWSYVCAFVIICVVTTFIIVRCVQEISSDTLPTFWDMSLIISYKNIDIIIAYLLCIIMPFAWFIVGANHSYIHAFMTYRILGISIFAFFSLCISLGCKLVIQKKGPFTTYYFEESDK